MNEVEAQILIISNKFDFSTDYVVRYLLSKNIPYCRINTDSFEKWGLTFDLSDKPLLIAENKTRFLIRSDNLQSIFFRAPVFLRGSSKDILGQSREQWAAFYRNLMLFQEANWVNNPISTYFAEHKMCQLSAAKKIGFTTPSTIASNSYRHVADKFIHNQELILKSIDTLMVRDKEKELFCYSQPIELKDLERESINSIPAFYQEHLYPKIDYRITVVGSEVFSVKILNNGNGVRGDWRLMKDDVEYIACEMPVDIKNKCILLTKSLGLQFGAIDLAYSNNCYYFIEINPTGEWGWLVEAVNCPIHISISELLCRKR